MQWHSEWYFNSRTHVECDQALETVVPHSSWISTHALTWSATTRFFLSFSIVTISTHALTWSATLTACTSLNLFLFQLTHSRGVRLGAFFIVPRITYFNSRTHVECDSFSDSPFPFFAYFNSRTHVECDDSNDYNGR